MAETTTRPPIVIEAAEGERARTAHGKRKTMRATTQHEGARARHLAETPSRHDAAAPAREGVATKGCETFWVEGEPREAPRRAAVPVARLGHPRMLELLGEAREEYGFEHEGAVVLPCGVERFMRAVEASAPAAGHGHHHHHFRLPHIHIARCFRPSRRIRSRARLAA